MNGGRFRRIVQNYWRRHGRHDLPWRHTKDPYAILVSEIMLQQTQVPRVVAKYSAFLAAFPSFRSLSRAPRSELLKVWQGLGYNRRALNLQRCAQAVLLEHGGRLPTQYSQLTALPGIGPYTAGAILAFVYDRPHPVIETNIRRVYLHHFFPKRRKVPDADILPLVSRHLSCVISPKDWYGALMDYGSHLATRVPNPNRRSRHHAKQAAFEGSLRQLRGRVLRLVVSHGPISRDAVRAHCGGDVRADSAVAGLIREGFLGQRRGLLKCA